MTPTIRVATPDDAPMIRQVYAYYIANTVATFNEAVKPEAAYRQSIETLLKTYPFLIAEDRGRFLGFANAEPMRAPSAYRFTPELTIYLHPDAPKHQGVGRLLYERLLALLQAQGFYAAYGVISATNEESLALHRACGFTEIARFANCGYKHGQWLSIVWMQKELNERKNPPPEPILFEVYRKGLAF